MTDRTSRTASDPIIGIAVILLCIYFLFETWALPSPMEDGPGPALFPTLILTGLLIAGVSLVLAGLPLRQGKTAEVGAGARALLPVLGTLAAIAAYVLALSWIPFLLATPVFVVVAALIALRFHCGRVQLVLLCVVAGLGSLVIQLVFINGLGIRL